MAIQGADLGQLQALVNQLAGPMQQNLQSVLNQMNSQVQQSDAYWVAQNANNFRQQFQQFVTTTTQQLQNLLAQASKDAGTNLNNIQIATGSAV